MKRMMCLLGVLGIWTSLTAHPGIIEGTVTDVETGSPLAGANVVLKGTELGAAADERGRFVIQDIPLGRYSVLASRMGYQSATETDIAVEGRRATQIVFELKEQALRTEAVNVSGSFFENSNEAVLSNHSFSSREIRSSPGSAEDVFRILKSIPGVSTTGSRSADLIVRGGNPNENLTLLDNVEIKSPLHFSREDLSMGVISIIDPAMIKNIEFLTGGFPAEFGDKLSSVFDLKVKEGNRTRFNHDLNLSMAGFNTYLDGPLPYDGSIVFSLRRGIFDLFTKMMNRKVEPRYWDMLGKLAYDLGSRHQISLIGFYYEDDAERRQKMEDHGELARRYEYMKWQDDGEAVGLNWRYLFDKYGFMLTTLEWCGDGNVSNIGNLSDRELNGDDNRAQSLKLKTKISYRITPQITLTAGAHLKRIDSDYMRWRAADTLKTGFMVPGFHRVFEMPVSYQRGVFVQGNLKSWGRFEIIPGIRYDGYDLTNEAYWSPRLGMACFITDRTTLDVAWGVYHQTPSPLYLSMDTENLRLKSSKAVQSIIGLGYLLAEDTRLTVEAYYKDYKDGFVGNDTSLVINNNGLGYSKGLEFTVEKKMSSNLMASLAYTWSFSKRQDSRDLPEYFFDYDRRHNLIVMASYQLTGPWRLGVKYQYASGNPYTPITGSKKLYGEWFLTEGASNSGRYPDYHSLDFRVDRAFRFRTLTLNLYLEVWNLFNHENVLDYYYNFSQDGAISKEVVSDFPVMPMLGFNVQF